MNLNLTEIVAILDKSGSMQTLTEDTIGGFNSFVERQKELPGDVVLTTVLFNSSYELLHDRKPLKKVKPLTKKNYIAEGTTALLDAMGKAINDIGLILHNTPEEDRPGKVIFFIITDGMENSSKEYKHQQIKEMVELQQNVYKWEFIFLGANMDAFSVGDSIGITKDRYNFRADSEGICFAFESVHRMVKEKRTHNKK